MWKRLYDTKSGMERGTLYQLRNLINRRNVKKEVKSNVSDSILSPGLWMEDDSVRKSAQMDVASAIIDKHIDLVTMFSGRPHESDDVSIQDSSDSGESIGDGGGGGGEGWWWRRMVVEKNGGSEGHVGSVYEYYREVLSLGILLYLYFKD